MGKRGSSSFKKLDVERALRSAREGGLEPAMLEIVAKDRHHLPGLRRQSRVHGDDRGAQDRQ